MLWLYRLLYPLGFLLLLPRTLQRALKRGGYGRDWRHRLGDYGDVPPRASGKQRVWVQAVSVGELQAAGPLLQALADDPAKEVVLTVTTSTAYALARERWTEQAAFVGLFPLDWTPFSARAWRGLQPDLAMLLESELWPEHLAQARRRGTPVLLLNARLSDRSYRRYQAFRGPARALVFRPLTRILASSPIDAERLAELAGPGTPVDVSGNLKIEAAGQTAPPTSEERLLLLRELGLVGAPATVPGGPSPAASSGSQARLGEAAGFGERPLILLGSSTWPGEEALLVEALREARAAGLDARLLLVPRHAERRRELMTWLETTGLAWHARSRGAAPGPVDVALADTTGELARLTHLADLVVVGKSFPPQTDGQSPLEAAAAGKALLWGPGMANFRVLARALLEAGAARQVRTADLGATVTHLLQDPAARDALGTSGKAWQEASRGALAQSLEAVGEALAPPNRWH